MELTILLIHLLAAVLLPLYLLVKAIVSLIRNNQKDKIEKIWQRTKISDWAFVLLLAASGLFVLISINHWEWYHLMKLAGVALVIYVLRRSSKANYASLVLISFILTVGILVLSIVKPLPEKNVATIPGKEEESLVGLSVFQAKCMECYGADGKLGRFGAIDLSGSVISLNDRVDAISNGRPLTVMRAFKNELTIEEIQSVAIYIEQLRSHDASN